jgi:AcrR family transcriptional regulator
MPRVTHAYLEARREEIVEAAMTCFGRDGFHKTTMQDIVRESGLSAGAIYRYFPSKDDIVAAITEARRIPNPSELTEAEEAADVRDAFRKLALGSLGRLSDRSERRWRRITVQVWAEALRDDRVMATARKGFDEPIEVIKGLVRRGQRDGVFPRDIDAEAAARVCASLFYGLVLQQTWDPDLDVDSYVEAVLSVLDGMATADH